jgi:hypothetical protein
MDFPTIHTNFWDAVIAVPLVIILTQLIFEGTFHHFIFRGKRLQNGVKILQERALILFESTPALVFYYYP